MDILCYVLNEIDAIIHNINILCFNNRYKINSDLITKSDNCISFKNNFYFS